MSNNVLSAVSGFDIQEEINAFCASKPKNIHSLKPASAAANAAEEPLAPVPAIQTTDTSIEIPQSERSITSFESSATQEPVPTPSVSDSNRSRAGSTKKAGRERKCKDYHFATNLYYIYSYLSKKTCSPIYACIDSTQAKSNRQQWLSKRRPGIACNEPRRW